MNFCNIYGSSLLQLLAYGRKVICVVNFDKFLTILYGAFHLYWFDKYVNVDNKL